MKFYLLLLLCSYNLLAQEDKSIRFTNFVEAYYHANTKEPLYIYESVHGQIVDTLNRIEAESSWYKIEIISSEYGWFKIKSIQQLPNSNLNFDYENYWVRHDNFLISAKNSKDTKSIYLYDEPSITSNKIHKVDHLQIMNIIETNDLWAMVSFKVGKKVINGWLHFNNQVAYH